MNAPERYDVSAFVTRASYTAHTHTHTNTHTHPHTHLTISRARSLSTGPSRRCLYFIHNRIRYITFIVCSLWRYIREPNTYYVVYIYVCVWIHEITSRRKSSYYFIVVHPNGGATRTGDYRYTENASPALL